MRPKFAELLQRLWNAGYFVSITMNNAQTHLRALVLYIRVDLKVPLTHRFAEAHGEIHRKDEVDLLMELCEHLEV